MSKQIGAGTTISGSVTGSIGQITDTVSGPDATIEDIETTDMDVDDAGYAKTFIPGLIDNGQINITVIYDGSAGGEANSLDTAFRGRTAETWTITYKDTSTRVFSGYINALGQETPQGDKITQPVGIKISGAVTFTDVAA